MGLWGFRKHDRISERWPKRENGDPVPPVFFQHVAGTSLDVEMVINLLEAYGLPVIKKYSNDGEFGELMVGFAGAGIDLMVPETMLEDAQNIVSGDIVEEPEE